MDNISGTFRLKLKGSSHEMRVTIGLAERIEQQIMRRPLIRLLKEAVSGEFYVTDLYRFFYEAVRENKDTRLSYEQIAQGILESGGADKFLPLYTEMLTYALTGNVPQETDSREDKKK